MKINQLFEAESEKHVTFCFGRMNPPTIGHKQLLDTMSGVGGDMRIFVSQSQDKKKNPLSYSEKVSFMRKLFPDYAGDIVENSSINTVVKAASYLYDQGYAHATFVAGSDRMEQMENLLKAYNGVEGKSHGYYKFDTLDFVSSGEREDGAEGVSGVSASLARAEAANGNIEGFAKATGAGENTEALYKAVRKGMGITDKEEMEERLQRKLKSLTESNLVVPTGSVRGVVIDLIKDKIIKTNDMETLSNWLKMIVGKTIEPRGQNRYTITSEDIEEALKLFKEHIRMNEMKASEIKPRNFVAKNAQRAGAGAHKDKKKAMKQGEQKHKGKMDESAYEHPAGAKLASIGRRIMDMSVTTKNDEVSNLMSRVGDELTRFGAPGGARDMKDLEKRCGCPYSVIEKLMKAALKRKDTSLDRVKDPEPSKDDDIGDFEQ